MTHNYKYRKHDTVINRLKIGYTQLTHGNLMAKKSSLTWEV